MTNSVTSEASSIEPPSRRDFLYLATASMAAVGAAATLWPFIDQMNPDASTVAAGGPVDIDLKQIEPGQQIVVLWSARPVFIANRTKPLLDALQDPKLVERLSDPNSTVLQQPSYAVNWHRSIKPEYLVLVGSARTWAASQSSFPRQPERPRAQLAGRVFLPLSRFEIRLVRSCVQRRSRALQSARAALSLSGRKDTSDR